MNMFSMGAVAAFTIAVAAFGGVSRGQAEDLVVAGEKIATEAMWENAKKEGVLVHYGTYGMDLMKVIHAGFTKDTGIKVEYVRLSGANVYQRVLSENSAGKLAADLVDLTDLVQINDFVAKGILAPHKVPGFDSIAADLKDPQGYWYGLVRPISLLAINTARIKEADAPKSWKELLDPKYDGLVGTNNIDGGSALSMFSFLRQKVDEDYWKKFAARKPKIYDGIAPLTTDLTRGEIAVATGPISEVVLSQMAAGAPVKVIFPSEGIPSFQIPAGITKSAAHPNAAALYLNWATSKRGGDLIASVGAYPLNASSNRPVKSGVEYPPYSEVWTLSADAWKANADNYRKTWLSTFGR